MKQTLVSILIPVYNRENFIRECIESALAQTYTNFEVVVVDNASTDGTWEICQQFVEKDQRVRVFRNDTNIGPVRNWLACVSQARGEYTKILWSDDLIHPEFLIKLLPYLDDPAVGFVYSSADVFEMAIDGNRTRLYASIGTGIYDASRYVNGALMGTEFPYSPGCAIFRTADVKRNLLLQVPIRVNSDFSMHAIGNDLLLFLLTAQENTNFAVVNEPLAYFRVHQGSITIASPTGNVALHYDLAKGYFAETFKLDKATLSKLNADFLLHLIRFRSVTFGINKLSDFYPTISFTGVSWGRIVMRLLRKITN